MINSFVPNRMRPHVLVKVFCLLGAHTSVFGLVICVLVVLRPMNNESLVMILLKLIQTELTNIFWENSRMIVFGLRHDKTKILNNLV